MPLGSSSATPVIRPGPTRESGCSFSLAHRIATMLRRRPFTKSRKAGMRARPRSVRNQQRYGRRKQDRSTGAAEDEFKPNWVRIGAHDDQIVVPLLDLPPERRVLLVGPELQSPGFDLDAVTQEVGGQALHIARTGSFDGGSRHSHDLNR